VITRKTNFMVPSSITSDENPPIHEIYSALISDFSSTVVGGFG
jgi:hypothetical protein